MNVFFYDKKDHFKPNFASVFQSKRCSSSPPECNCLQEPVVTANKKLWDKQLDYNWYTQILMSRI